MIWKSTECVVQVPTHRTSGLSASKIDHIRCQMKLFDNTQFVFIRTIIVWPISILQISTNIIINLCATLRADHKSKANHKQMTNFH